MIRNSIPARLDWRTRVESVGFDFHTFDGEPYWVDDAYYEFTLEQIENDLEDPTDELVEMCYEAVSYVCGHPELLHKLAIPEGFHKFVVNSWAKHERDLYGRFDLSYNGLEPAKLLEYNADTPTSLLESAVVQWQWLEDQKALGNLPEDADQFNSIYERIKFAFTHMDLPEVMHFTGALDSYEDSGNLAMIADIAAQCGKVCNIIDIRDIGVSGDNWFTDMQDRPIEAMFKLYPWEDMVREEFAPMILLNHTKILEPAWKMILSNKGILPILWMMFEGHKNLLPAFFDDDPKAMELTQYARKPLFSREGANVELVNNGLVLENVPGEYDKYPMIRQQLTTLPRFGLNHAVIGSWVVAGKSCGIGIREDQSLVTKDTSLFIPHIIRG